MKHENIKVNAFVVSELITNIEKQTYIENNREYLSKEVSLQAVKKAVTELISKGWIETYRSEMNNAYSYSYYNQGNNEVIKIMWYPIVRLDECMLKDKYVWVFTNIHTYIKRPSEYSSMVYKDKEEAIKNLKEKKEQELGIDSTLTLHASTEKDDLISYHYIGDEDEVIFLLERFELED